MNVETDVVGLRSDTIRIRVTGAIGIHVGILIVLQINSELRSSRRHVTIGEILPAGVRISGQRHLRKSFDFYAIVSDGASRVRILPSQIEMIDL